MDSAHKAIAMALMAACLVSLRAHAEASEYFTIRVVDEETSRGVPLVQLTTTNAIVLVTDSNGIAAFNEPGLMDGQQVYFHIKSHGYEYPCDGFGQCGAKLFPVPGGRVELKIKRINVAERLYRVTGGGIYRDSLLVGYPVPLKEPALSGKVLGQDSVITAIYRNKLYWFWGDTSRPAYPLGNFATSGATSELPGTGVLAPSAGVDLTYFVNEEGFSKEMCRVPGPGVVWCDALMALKGDSGAEQLVLRFMRMKDLGTPLEWGLAVFNDTKAAFDPVAPLDMALPLFPRGAPLPVRNGGQDYCYFGLPHPLPFPNVRARANLEALKDQRAYEAFSCLEEGARYEGGHTRLERDGTGRLVYGWKRDTAPLGYDEIRELAKLGKMQDGESQLQFRDIETGKAVQMHAGDAQWNEYRQRWVLIGQEVWGTSFSGEIWYAEADTPVGPWVYGRKIVTHDDYTFYNPRQHVYFAEDGGRTLHFEGSYTHDFSGAPTKTPRYDYNQIMYRLNLGDTRLFLPVPVYRVESDDGGSRYLLRKGVEAEACWNRVAEIPFFALEPGRQSGNALPVAAPIELEASPLFYVLPLDREGSAAERLKPVYRYSNEKEGRYLLSTDPALDTKGFTRSREALGGVWGNPMTVLALDPYAKAVRP